mgnify:CR=1 FL=1
MKELGIYIHIPFCVKKCYYCDFVSYPDKLDYQKEYIEKIKQEIREEQEVFNDADITTIYIGGGTPSIIDSKYIIEILEYLYKFIGKKDREITIEINPGTINKTKLQDYKKAGINRISIGLQSSNDKILKTIGRIHNFEDFLKAYNLVVEEGFENINVDLMLGLPLQTIEDIKQSINEVLNLKLKPKHISIYSLIVEENTQLDKMLDEGKITLPNDEYERKEYAYTKNTLELNGYKHYEISNFAQEGYESKHNVNCWKQKEYIGLGVAAHSYINGIRFSNTTNLPKYLKNEKFEIPNEKEIEELKKKIDKQNNEYKLPLKIGIKTIHEIQNEEDMQNEYMILGLRMLEGVKISEFKQKFVENPIYLFRKELEKLVDEQLIEIDLDNIKLTRKGLDLANIVWKEFI